MSATVDRVCELESATVALPWPPGVYSRLGMPAAAKALLTALGQAWPLLREEITSLEQRVTESEAAIAQLHSEHQRIVAGSTALGQQLDALKIRHDNETASLRGELLVARRESVADRAALAALPRRIVAAEKVCASIKTTMPGPARAVPHGAHGWFDGSALDEWRRAP